MIEAHFRFCENDAHRAEHSSCGICHPCLRERGYRQALQDVRHEIEACTGSYGHVIEKQALLARLEKLEQKQGSEP